MNFPVEVVLSVTTHKLLTPVDNLYNILNYMLDTSLMTHELSGANEICTPHLLKLYPELNVNCDGLRDFITPFEDKVEGCREWIKTLNLKESYDVPQVDGAAQAHLKGEEMLDKLGDKVIMVET